MAASRPLPTFPFDPGYRHIAVVDLARRPGATYHSRLLSLPFAYDVTSRFGCGCGLQVTPDELVTLAQPTSPVQLLEPIRAALEDFQRMADLIEIGLEAGPVEIFTCWDSDCFAVQVETRCTVTLSQLRQPGFPLVDRQVVTVV